MVCERAILRVGIAQ